ncbi:GNAT family N-acetyltransferase [Virgibacillus litoralis]|uniref:RimJ/RimL family protein N-acetyltransferase n=1 Tax=Virgibacillus litoralis TaxID=578221 RepID=A0ABS4HHV8_9BACI|nr:GNAT family N-acetyltransferase [Virgibacillus litoralis]MBP1950512.1 RimJ/RimL family protein N-acetyltransferase [Virgibacillus litoralis]
MDTFEVTGTFEEALQETNKYDGHYTLKIGPLESPELLLKYNFYYMDTLIEPLCKKENLHLFDKDATSITKDYNPSEIILIAEESFKHGRFHRDFNIPNSMADTRYMNWVKDLQEKDQIFALMYEDDIAGFFAYEDDKVLLLGIKEEYRSRGLAKAFTSQGCAEQFKLGYNELRTSISAANVASLNLFYSLGFRLINTVDVYHKVTGPGV